MRDIDKTKEQLISELVEIRQQLAKEEELEIKEALVEHDLAERTKELQCIYGISRITGRSGITLDELYQGIVNLLPSSWQYPDITCARIIINNREFRTENYRETRFKQSAGIMIHDNETGRVEIAYLKKRPASYEGPFLKEERMLINAVANELGQIAKQKEAEAQLLANQRKLRALTYRLSLTKEHERQHISMEIHHRISQPLFICQNNLRAMEKSAPSIHFVQDVAKIRVIIAELIEETKAMTFKISLPILYEFGIVAALSHLIEQLQEQHEIVFSFEDDGHPKLLDDEIAMLLFQMIRELLTNIVKHSKARHARVCIKRHDNDIHIIVKDDGFGFNMSTIISDINKTKGFGLFSIHEQINHIGGIVEVESELGRGSRFKIVVPLKQNRIKE